MARVSTIWARRHSRRPASVPEIVIISQEKMTKKKEGLVSVFIHFRGAGSARHELHCPHFREEMLTRAWTFHRIGTGAKWHPGELPERPEVIIVRTWAGVRADVANEPVLGKGTCMKVYLCHFRLNFCTWVEIFSIRRGLTLARLREKKKKKSLVSTDEVSQAHHYFSRLLLVMRRTIFLSRLISIKVEEKKKIKNAEATKPADTCKWLNMQRYPNRSSASNHWIHGQMK